MKRITLRRAGVTIALATGLCLASAALSGGVATASTMSAQASVAHVQSPKMLCIPWISCVLPF